MRTGESGTRLKKRPLFLIFRHFFIHCLIVLQCIGIVHLLNIAVRFPVFIVKCPIGKISGRFIHIQPKRINSLGQNVIVFVTPPFGSLRFEKVHNAGVPAFSFSVCAAPGPECQGSFSIQVMYKMICRISVFIITGRRGGCRYIGIVYNAELKSCRIQFRKHSFRVRKILMIPLCGRALVLIPFNVRKHHVAGNLFLPVGLCHFLNSFLGISVMALHISVCPLGRKKGFSHQIREGGGHFFHILSADKVIAQFSARRRIHRAERTRSCIRGSQIKLGSACIVKINGISLGADIMGIAQIPASFSKLRGHGVRLPSQEICTPHSQIFPFPVKRFCFFSQSPELFVRSNFIPDNQLVLIIPSNAFRLVFTEHIARLILIGQCKLGFCHFHHKFSGGKLVAGACILHLQLRTLFHLFVYYGKGIVPAVKFSRWLTPHLDDIVRTCFHPDCCIFTLKSHFICLVLLITAALPNISEIRLLNGNVIHICRIGISILPLQFNGILPFFQFHGTVAVPPLVPASQCGKPQLLLFCPVHIEIDGSGVTVIACTVTDRQGMPPGFFGCYIKFQTAPYISHAVYKAVSGISSVIRIDFCVSCLHGVFRFIDVFYFEMVKSDSRLQISGRRYRPQYSCRCEGNGCPLSVLFQFFHSYPSRLMK